MMITTKTTVSFLLPKEIKAVEKFEQENDMALWKQTETGMSVTYARMETYEANV